MHYHSLLTTPLPYPSDIAEPEEAIELLRQRADELSAALMAKCVAIAISKGRLRGKEIQNWLACNKHQVSHLKRCGERLSAEVLDLGHRNAERISLGHLRYLMQFRKEDHEAVVRDLIDPLKKKKSVAQLAARLKSGQGNSRDASSFEAYAETVSETIGSPVGIQYNPKTGNGTLSIQWFGLDDLERLLEKLGYKVSRSEDDW